MHRMQPERNLVGSLKGASSRLSFESTDLSDLSMWSLGQIEGAHERHV